MPRKQPKQIVRYGLENVVAVDSSICLIDGKKGVLLYRGYPIEDLAEKSTFEEVCFLLLHGELPDTQQLEQFKKELVAGSKPPEAVFRALDALPRTTLPMDALRTGASVLGAIDRSPAPEKNLNRAKLAIASFPTISAAFMRFTQGQSRLPPHPNLGLAANFLTMLRGKVPSPEEARLFDRCLIFYAEHGINASTFAARVTTSTLGDYWSAITSAIGTLKGPLHGGANAKILEMLTAIESKDKVASWVEDKLAKKELIMGIGHRVYKKKDPRAVLLKKYAKALQKKAPDPQLLDIAIAIEKDMWKRKKLPANVDFYMAIVLHWLGIPQALYPCIFAMGRIPGWSAQVMEQLADNRLIRPRAKYVGPKARKYPD